MDGFYAVHAPASAPDTDELVMTFDGKGVVMRPDGLQAATAKAAAGMTPFADLVTKVMTHEPNASARRVCWIVDNGSSHRGHASVDRMAKAWPTANLVYVPVHASWLSQVEISFRSCKARC